MKRIFVLITLICLLIAPMAGAESIMPVLSELKEPVEVPSVHSVSWNEPSSVDKNDDGSITYYYYSISERVYTAFGEALGAEGYALTANETTEEGYYRFILFKDDMQIEILYYGDEDKMYVTYPENALLRDRVEADLTTELALGEAYVYSNEETKALLSVREVDTFRYIYTSGYPVVFAYDKWYTPSEGRTYVFYHLKETSTAAYDIAGSRSLSDDYELKINGETTTVYKNGGYFNNFYCHNQPTGVSNEAGTLINDRAEPTLTLGAVGYCGMVTEIDSSYIEDKRDFEYPFYDYDKLHKYVYRGEIQSLQP